MAAMYRNETSRSWTSVTIWVSAFAAMTLIAAWQFEWFPTDAADKVPLRPRAGFDSVVDGNSPAHTTPETEVSDEPRDRNRDLEPLEPPPNFDDPGVLFAHQSEPLPPAPHNDSPSNRNRTDSSIALVGGESPAGEFTPTEAPTNPSSPPTGPREETAHVVPANQNPPNILQLDPENPPRPIESAGPPAVSTGNEHPVLVAAANNQPQLSPPQSVLDEIDALQNKGTPKSDIAAHKKLSQLYWEHPEWREALQGRLRKTAALIYFSPQPHYMTAYEIQAGDRLEKVSKLYGVPWQYLASLNRTDPRRIRPGQKLKVIKGPFGAVVDLKRFELTIEHHGFVVKRYRIGVGADNSTPIGTFTVKNKLANPTYYGPNGLVIDADDPTNPLGEHWIDIGDSYGIHGTIDPKSIGKAESRGCVRMLNKDVSEVFQFLGIGSTVRIRR